MECGAKILEFGLGSQSVRISCSRCSLGDLCLPRGLDEKATTRFEQIVERCQPMHAGDHLYRDGDPFRALVAVRSGCFKSYLINEEGEERVVAFHLPGELVGLDAIHEGVHNTSCVALDTSSVCELDYETLADLARQVPLLQDELFKIMSRNITKLEHSNAANSADQRFAKFLESLSQRYSRRGYSAHEFTLAMSRRDIASCLHMATETVSRILARLKKEGVIDVRRRQVRILNPDVLHAIATSE